MHFTKDNNLIQSLKSLLSKAVAFGVSNEGKLIIEEYIEYHEFGLAFEHIVYELNENSISISNEYYNEIKKVSELMKLNESEYKPRLEKLILK
jgi:hypothetical protein